MSHITAPLTNNLSIEFIQFREIFAILACPFDQVVGDNLKVGNSVGARLHAVITQIFILRSWIDFGAGLAAIEVNRIVCTLNGPFVKLFFLFFERHVAEPGVSPFYSPLIIFTDSGKEVCYSVTRLSDIVESGIVHNGWSCTVIGGIGWRSK